MSSFYWIILAQHTSLPTNHLTNPNSQTIVNSSLSLSPALQTTLPPELKFTRLCLSFHCQYILFHQNQLNILLANSKLLEHYDNTWCVTNSALFSQLLPDLASNRASCSIETISTITSQLQVLCAVKLQIHSGILFFFFGHSIYLIAILLFQTTVVIVLSVPCRLSSFYQDFVCLWVQFRVLKNVWEGYNGSQGCYSLYIINCPWNQNLIWQFHTRVQEDQSSQKALVVPSWYQTPPSCCGK